jgi:D-sedoheptulose 7-phosphate isomerase
MDEIAKKYYDKLIKLFGLIGVTDKDGNQLDFYQGIELAAQLVTSDPSHKMIFIGNGASAAIASHMSTDFWKNGGIRAIAFNDASLLTCISNDFGTPHLFEKPIEMFADEADVLFAISSSGRSENILTGVQAARSAGGHVITLSGFRSDNPLSSLGDLNFYVPAEEYGPVEIIHHSICHCILDTIIKKKREH